MNPEMVEKGRRLEAQVAATIQLLAGIQADLAAIPDCPSATDAKRQLAEHRAALHETVASLQQSQTVLAVQLQQHVSTLADREAALEASRGQLHALTRRLVEVQEDERRALARDLHDTAGQGMTVIGLGLSLLKREGVCSPAVRGRIEDLQRTAEAVAEDLHRLSVNLRPSSLDRYGLVPASEELVASLRKQTGIEVNFEVEGLGERLPDDMETALYRIVQEGCTNIARHAAASRASIAIRRNRNSIRVSLEDDGRGFDVAAALSLGRLGLVGMRERAEILGGVCTIASSPGQGTRIAVEAPLPGQGAEGGGREQPLVAPVPVEVSSQAAELSRIQVLSDALAEITERMPGFESAAGLLEFVLTRAAAAVGCDYAVIASRMGGHWIATHAYNLPPSLLGQRLVPGAAVLADEIERTRRVVVVNDPASGGPLAAAARDSGVFSGAGFPLIATGQLLGAVAFVHNSAPIPFRPSEVGFLRHLTGVISLVLEIIQLRAG